MASQINCTLYARSSKDAHDIAPATQLKELRAFAAKRGYKVVAERQDAAISANDDPPQLAAILQELKDPARGWSVIVAMDSSRIARDMDLAGVINYQVRKAGAKLEYSKHPATDNAAMDMFREAIMRGFDAYHSLISKQKGLAGMKQNVEAGHRAGGRAPLGYMLKRTPTGAIRDGKPVTKSSLVPDPECAPRVKRYLQARATGHTRVAAARASGLTDKNSTSLIGIERNALVYAGITVWNRHSETGLDRYRPRKEWIVKRGTHRALIDEKTADAIMAAAMPTTRKPRSPSGEFLLSGFLFTPEGKALVSSGDDYYRESNGRGEKRRRVRADSLEAVVLDLVNEERDGHEFMDRFIHEAKRAAAALTTAPVALERERKRITQRLANWMRLAEQEPNSPTILGQLRLLEAERENVEKALQDAAKNAQTKSWLNKLTPAAARKMMEGWYERDGATTEERRAALAQIVEKIVFDPDTGTGRIHYRIGLNGAKFNIKSASGVLLASLRGFEPRLPP